MGEQVEEHLAQAAPVGGDHDVGRAGGDDGDGAVGRHGLDERGSVVCEVADRHLLEGQVEPAGFDGPDVEQLLDQLVEVVASSSSGTWSSSRATSSGTSAAAARCSSTYSGSLNPLIV